MSLRVQCQNCSSSHSVNKRLLGRSMRCPVCDATIEVPADLKSVSNGKGEQEVFVVEVISPTDTDFVDAEPVEVEPISVADSLNPNGSKSSKRTSKKRASKQIKQEDEEELGEVEFAKRELPKDDMDMTPMVDVTFLLLIFFMITASFSSEKVLEEPPPLSDRASTNAREEPDKILDTVRVQIDEFNAYTIILPGGEDHPASSKQDLLIALGEARKELITGANDDSLKLAIEAHTESIHVAVVAAIDAGREKGFSSIQVTVVEEFD